MATNFNAIARQRRLKALETLSTIKSNESDEFRQLRRRGLGRAYSCARGRFLFRSESFEQREMHLLAA